MSLTRCPICRRQFNSEQSPAAMPFCSERCRRVDLGRWLNEDYGLPFEPSEEDSSEDSPDDDSSND